MEFYEKAQDVVKGFDVFQNQYASPGRREERISVSSQHYDFLPLFDDGALIHPENKNFRIFESTTVQILDEVAQGIVSWDYSNKGIMQRGW